MITVTAALIQKDNKILITRRSPGKHLAGLWEFPGGKLENGETEQECLSRELEEELGIKVKVGEFFMENTHDYGTKSILLKAYFCKQLTDSITLNDHDMIAWVTKKELQNYEFAPADVPFIKALLNE
jgi:8-oxo-dGTP diphosphatase